MSEANKSLVRRLVEEAINKGNLSVVDEILADGYVYREPTVGEKRGRAGYRELVTMYRNAFPDLKLTIEEQITEGDKVVTRTNGTGTHRGELFGTAPTGKHDCGGAASSSSAASRTATRQARCGVAICADTKTF